MHLKSVFLDSVEVDCEPKKDSFVSSLEQQLQEQRRRHCMYVSANIREHKQAKKSAESLPGVKSIWTQKNFILKGIAIDGVLTRG